MGGNTRVVVMLLVGAVLAQDDNDVKAAAAKEAPKKPSTLAPLVPYLKVWEHIHSKDQGAPKMLLLLDDEDAAEAPSWFSTVAMKYKEGRKKSVAFVAVKGGKDAKNAATRFGLLEVPAGGALFACVPSADGSGYSQMFDGSLESGGAGSRARAVKAFVDGVLEGVPEEERAALPAFPEPTRPRKAAAVTLDEFTHETLPLRCYGVQAKPLCVFALLPAFAGEGCPASVTALAKRFANDPISFGCVGAAKQDAFLAAYGLDAAALPAMVAVKAGKRPRFAKLEGNALEEAPMAGFVDNLLGGGATFKRLDELPDLEAPYLLDKDEV